MNVQNATRFKETVWDYYNEHSRSLPWRNPERDGTYDPYKIMVSEIMLQQTQATRVAPKYQDFLKQFPTVEVLASASLGDVLSVWSGLGYNRRAKFLWQAAIQIVDTYDGVFPQNIPELKALPGIGGNTAGAILAYAYNQPVVFIETNIRTVFIHYFFADRGMVADAEIYPLVLATMDPEHPREWYWALMDYGVYIKSTIGNVSRDSKHYAKQSTFQGSKRQIRGQVIRLLTATSLSVKDLEAQIADERLVAVLTDLQTEGLIHFEANRYNI